MSAMIRDNRVLKVAFKEFDVSYRVSRYTLLFMLALMSIVPAFAQNTVTYLALGDSVSFGMNPLLFVPYQSPPPATAFVGYPEVLAQVQPQGTTEINGSCAGETSSSFLVDSLGLNPMPVIDNGCNTPHSNPDVPALKSINLLHTVYTTTQMAFAISELTNNSSISLVTLSIGGNDLLMLQAFCATNWSSYKNYQSYSDCVAGELPSTLSSYGTNLATILGGIKATGYNGTIVLVEYYAPSADALTVKAIQALNDTMATVVHAPSGQFSKVKLADGFTAFQLASARYPTRSGYNDPCKAGLLIQLPTHPVTCDVHPTLLGQQVLAGTVVYTIATQH